MVERVVHIGWRVLAVAVVYAVFFLLLGLLSGGRLSPRGGLLGLVTGAGFALVLLPLARRLPYRTRTRVIALFAPLYWIYSLGNLVEAYFLTTYPHSTLILGAVFLILPSLVVSWMVAGLFPALPQEGQPSAIGELLGQRPLLSWVWRVLLAGLLFAVLLQLFGAAWGPLIARYYHDSVYLAQAHIASPPPPGYVIWIEEVVRGVVFAVVLLPLLAVVRGRTWPTIAFLAAYVALVDAALESWLTMLNSAFPIGFRVGEGLDLTTDAIARGVFIAALLALPVVASRQRPAPEPVTAH